MLQYQDVSACEVTRVGDCCYGCKFKEFVNDCPRCDTDVEITYQKDLFSIYYATYYFDLFTNRSEDKPE